MQPYPQGQYGYYPQMGGYPAGQYAPQPPQGAPSGPLPTSGGSTPSAGVRTPVSGPPSTAGIPPSPSPSHPLAPNTPHFTPAAYSSPQPQSATLPHYGGMGTPLRAVGASEFKPSLAGDAAPFTPSPRKSAAIKIRNPKEVQEEKEKAAAAAAAKAKAEGVDVTKAEEKKVEETKAEEKKVEEKAAIDAEEKKVEDDKVEKEKADKAASEKKVEEEKAAKEKAAAEEKAIKEKAEAESKKLEQEKAEKQAAETKAKIDEEEKKAAADKEDASKSAAAAPVAELKTEKAAVDAKADTPEPAAEEATAEEKKETGAQTLADARSAIPSNNLPSFLPPKPVNGAGEASPSTPKVETPAAPSPLNTARSIHDLSSVSYPESVKAPRPELNAEAQPGKYRYDREFLLQFMAVCTEKPETLPNLEAIGMVDSESGNQRGNFGSGSRRSSQMGPPAVPSRQGSMSGGFGSRSTSGGGVGGAFGGMGNFGQAPLGSSEARFAQSLGRSASGAFPSRPGSMSRTSSQSGMITPGGNFVPAGDRRTTSSRGGKRRQDDSQGGSRRRDGGDGGNSGKHVSGDGFENATLAPRSETGWAPTVAGGAAPSDPNSPEMVQRKVKALLNKLTLERFESISNQILEWADKSVDETDGRILRQVIALIFEKATDEANWSEMYARLCRKLMEKVSANVKDETVKGQDGNPVAGGALFRKYLLNRCQEDYEAGWKAKEASAAAAAASAASDAAKKDANDAAEKEAKENAESGKSSSSAPKEAELLSDEYYAAQKAKRRGLGLVRFIGELYRLQMLTERIMHECIKKLLANTENPDEEDIESLCRLLTTVGKGLDNPKAKQHMDIYFSRMALIGNNPKIPSRMRFMIQVSLSLHASRPRVRPLTFLLALAQDVAELRAGRWQPRHDSAGPKLISEIHSDVRLAFLHLPPRSIANLGSLPTRRRRRPPMRLSAGSPVRAARDFLACTTSFLGQTPVAVRVATSSASPLLELMDGAPPFPSGHRRPETSAPSVAFAIPLPFLSVPRALLPPRQRQRRLPGQQPPATPSLCLVAQETLPSFRPASGRSSSSSRGRCLSRARRRRERRAKRRTPRRTRTRTMEPSTPTLPACRGPRESVGQTTVSRRWVLAVLTPCRRVPKLTCSLLSTVLLGQEHLGRSRVDQGAARRVPRYPHPRPRRLRRRQEGRRRQPYPHPLLRGQREGGRLPQGHARVARASRHWSHRLVGRCAFSLHFRCESRALLLLLSAPLLTSLFPYSLHY